MQYSVTDRQTRKSQSNYRTSRVHCARPAGKKNKALGAMNKPMCAYVSVCLSAIRRWLCICTDLVNTKHVQSIVVSRYTFPTSLQESTLPPAHVWGCILYSASFGNTRLWLDSMDPYKVHYDLHATRQIQYKVLYPTIWHRLSRN